MQARLFAGALAVLAAATPCAAASDNSSSIEALALVALTRETRATYTVVLANYMYLPDGREVAEWSAEFHDGIRHRVETPRDRMVADCETMTGTHLNLDRMEVSEEPYIARVACGIQAVSPILSARIAGERQTQFGVVTHLVVVDKELIRTYDVANNGALLGATITGRDGDKKLVARAVHYSEEVPADIFGANSLGRSAVPPRLRNPG